MTTATLTRHAAPGRPAGRPRCDATRQSILRAAYEILAEAGLRGFTIEGVAARSGVARTTIYRWWSRKGALAMEGLLAAVTPEIASPATSSAVADLKTQVGLCAKLLRGPAGRIVAGILAEGQTDPDTIGAFLDGYLSPRRREVADILKRGIESGELRADLDIPTIQSALYSPLHLRLLLRESIDAAWVERLCDTVLRGCLP